jgi:predicted transcriptional regulator
MDKSELLTLTSRIVAAHVARNSVALSDLPNLIQQIFGALSGAGGEAPGPPERPQPAVPVKRSVTDEYIVCLEDGKRLKMLKRHLKTAYDMTPEQYRERWNLPADYPMAAPKYALARRELAKKIGLGTKRRKSHRS